MFEKVMMTILNRKMLNEGKISNEEFERLQEKINVMADDTFENRTENSYNQDAV